MSSQASNEFLESPSPPPPGRSPIQIQESLFNSAIDIFESNTDYATLQRITQLEEKIESLTEKKARLENDAYVIKNNLDLVNINTIGFTSNPARNQLLKQYAAATKKINRLGDHIKRLTTTILNLKNGDSPIQQSLVQNNEQYYSILSNAAPFTAPGQSPLELLQEVNNNFRSISNNVDNTFENLLDSLNNSLPLGTSNVRSTTTIRNPTPSPPSNNLISSPNPEVLDSDLNFLFDNPSPTNLFQNATLPPEGLHYPHGLGSTYHYKIGAGTEYARALAFQAGTGNPLTETYKGKYGVNRIARTKKMMTEYRTAPANPESSVMIYPLVGSYLDDHSMQITATGLPESLKSVNYVNTQSFTRVSFLVSSQVDDVRVPYYVVNLFNSVDGQCTCMDYIERGLYSQIHNCKHMLFARVNCDSEQRVYLHAVTQTMKEYLPASIPMPDTTEVELEKINKPKLIDPNKKPFFQIPDFISSFYDWLLDREPIKKLFVNDFAKRSFFERLKNNQLDIPFWRDVIQRCNLQGGIVEDTEGENIIYPFTERELATLLAYARFTMTNTDDEVLYRVGINMLGINPTQTSSETKPSQLAYFIGYLVCYPRFLKTALKLKYPPQPMTPEQEKNRKDLCFSELTTSVMQYRRVLCRYIYWIKENEIDTKVKVMNNLIKSKTLTATVSDLNFRNFYREDQISASMVYSQIVNDRRIQSTIITSLRRNAINQHQAGLVSDEYLQDVLAVLDQNQQILSTTGVTPLPSQRTPSSSSVRAYSHQARIVSTPRNVGGRQINVLEYRLPSLENLSTPQVQTALRYRPFRYTAKGPVRQMTTHYQTRVDVGLARGGAKPFNRQMNNVNNNSQISSITPTIILPTENNVLSGVIAPTQQTRIANQLNPHTANTLALINPDTSDQPVHALLHATSNTHSSSSKSHNTINSDEEDETNVSFNKGLTTDLSLDQVMESSEFKRFEKYPKSLIVTQFREKNGNYIDESELGFFLENLDNKTIARVEAMISSPPIFSEYYRFQTRHTRKSFQFDKVLFYNRIMQQANPPPSLNDGASDPFLASETLVQETEFGEATIVVTVKYFNDIQYIRKLVLQNTFVNLQQQPLLKQVQESIYFQQFCMVVTKPKNLQWIIKNIYLDNKIYGEPNYTSSPKGRMIEENNRDFLQRQIKNQLNHYFFKLRQLDLYAILYNFYLWIQNASFPYRVSLPVNDLSQEIITSVNSEYQYLIINLEISLTKDPLSIGEFATTQQPTSDWLMDLFNQTLQSLGTPLPSADASTAVQLGDTVTNNPYVGSGSQPQQDLSLSTRTTLQNAIQDMNAIQDASALVNVAMQDAPMIPVVENPIVRMNLNIPLDQIISLLSEDEESNASSDEMLSPQITPFIQGLNYWKGPPQIKKSTLPSESIFFKRFQQQFQRERSNQDILSFIGGQGSPQKNKQRKKSVRGRARMVTEFTSSPQSSQSSFSSSFQATPPTISSPEWIQRKKKPSSSFDLSFSQEEEISEPELYPSLLTPPSENPIRAVRNIQFVNNNNNNNSIFNGTINNNNYHNNQELDLNLMISKLQTFFTKATEKTNSIAHNITHTRFMRLFQWMNKNDTAYTFVKDFYNQYARANEWTHPVWIIMKHFTTLLRVVHYDLIQNRFLQGSPALRVTYLSRMVNNNLKNYFKLLIDQNILKSDWSSKNRTMNRTFTEKRRRVRGMIMEKKLLDVYTSIISYWRNYTKNKIEQT